MAQVAQESQREKYLITQFKCYAFDSKTLHRATLSKRLQLLFKNINKDAREGSTTWTNNTVTKNEITQALINNCVIIEAYCMVH